MGAEISLKFTGYETFVSRNRLRDADPISVNLYSKVYAILCCIGHDFREMWWLLKEPFEFSRRKV